MPGRFTHPVGIDRGTPSQFIGGGECGPISAHSVGLPTGCPRAEHLDVVDTILESPPSLHCPGGFGAPRRISTVPREGAPGYLPRTGLRSFHWTTPPGTYS